MRNFSITVQKLHQLHRFLFHTNYQLIDFPFQVAMENQAGNRYCEPCRGSYQGLGNSASQLTGVPDTNNGNSGKYLNHTDYRTQKSE